MKKMNLKAMSCATCGNKIYFASSEFNSVYALNTDTNTVEFFDNVPDEKFTQSNLYGHIIYYSGRLFLVPLCAEKIWIYDIGKKEWSGYGFPEKLREIPYKFFGAVLHKEYIYMLGHYYPGIIRFNTNTCIIEEIDISLQQKDDSEYNGIFVGWDCVIKENWLYASITNSNQVLKLKLETHEYELIQIGKNGNKYAGIVWDGKYFWLPPRKNSSYVRWDGGKGVKEYALPKEFDKEQYYFSGAYLVGNKVVFSGFAGFTLKFSKDEPEKPIVIDRRNTLYEKINDTDVILQDDIGNISIHKGDDTEEQVICLTDENKLPETVARIIFESSDLGMMSDSSLIPLKYWFRHIPVKEDVTLNSSHIGKKIYDALINMEG